MRRRLYWSGLYTGTADKEINWGSDIVDPEIDYDALKLAMEAADANGFGLRVFTKQMAEKGRAHGGPLGVPTKEPKATTTGADGVDDFVDPTDEIWSYIDANGIKVGDRYVAKQVRAVATGAATLEDVQKDMQALAVAKYPAWSDQIKSGLSVADIAAPYKQAMAQTLELPEDAIDLDDPSLRSALSATGPDGKPSYQPLWAFQDQLKKDPRWQKTDNAWQEVGGQVDSVMSEMGLR